LTEINKAGTCLANQRWKHIVKNEYFFQGQSKQTYALGLHSVTLNAEWRWVKQLIKSFGTVRVYDLKMWSNAVLPVAKEI